MAERATGPSKRAIHCASCAWFSVKAVWSSSKGSVKKSAGSKDATTVPGGANRRSSAL